MGRPVFNIPTTTPQRTVMAPRQKIVSASPVIAPPIPGTSFITSGSFLMDCVLGGGWAGARIINVVGDKSTGKTLVAIEACANFAAVVPIENIRYVEAEAAFDVEYGKSMGFPAGLVPADTIRTVEEFTNDLDAFLTEQKKNKFPCLYIVDSLDALSDTAEMERDVDKGSYGASKAKKLSEMFRKRTRDLEQAFCTLFIISQIRDKLNVTFGETKTRAGGKALDFYASQVIWLIELNKIKRTVLGVERVVGIHVMVRNRKNKVGAPYREAEQTLLFNYGFDDEISMIEWLHKCKAITNAPIWRDAVSKARTAQDRVALSTINQQLREMVWTRWNEIETKLAPTLSKYGS